MHILALQMNVRPFPPSFSWCNIIPAVDPLLSLLVDPLQVGVQVVLPVRPLSVVRLEVEAGVVPTAGVAHVVLGEPVLVLPPLGGLLRAQLRDGEVLLPVMGPVQLSRWRLSSPDILSESDQ